MENLNFTLEVLTKLDTLYDELFREVYYSSNKTVITSKSDRHRLTYQDVKDLVETYEAYGSKVVPGHAEITFMNDEIKMEWPSETPKTPEQIQEIFIDRFHDKAYGMIEDLAALNSYRPINLSPLYEAPLHFYVQAQDSNTLAKLLDQCYEFIDPDDRRPEMEPTTSNH